jgi:hypothetical protein
MLKRPEKSLVSKKKYKRKQANRKKNSSSGLLWDIKKNISIFVSA